MCCGLCGLISQSLISPAILLSAEVGVAPCLLQPARLRFQVAVYTRKVGSTCPPPRPHGAKGRRSQISAVPRVAAGRLR